MTEPRYDIALADERDIARLTDAILFLAGALHARGSVSIESVLCIQSKLTAPHPDTATTSATDSAPPSGREPIQPPAPPETQP